MNSLINTCILSSNLDNINNGVIYYSHLIPVVFALFLAILVFIKSKRDLLAKIFLAFSVTFSAWLIGDLIIWTQNNYYLIYFAWSTLAYIEIVFYILGLDFATVFIIGKHLPVGYKWLFIGVTIPPFVITMMNKAVEGFNYPVCEAFNNSFLDIYKLVLEIIIVAIIFVFMLLPFLQKKVFRTKKESLIVLGSVFLFLTVFGLTEYLSAVTGNYELNLYALFIIPVFLVAMTYSIFSLDIFNTKTLSTYFFVFGFLILNASQFFFVSGTADRFITFLTMGMSVIFGIFLFRNLFRESQQRIYVTRVNEQLQELLKQRESLVHLITHKVKGSFTHSKYIFAGLLEGMYGEVSPEIKKIAQYGLKSDDAGIHTVDLVLNASNLQKGTVKYDLKPTDLKKLYFDAIKEREEAIKEKGLELIQEIDEKDNFMVNADAFWLKEVLNNLIENSLKYTPSGSMIVGLKKLASTSSEKGNKAIFYVKDTGIGITDEDKKNLFKEGGRGKESVKINVDSTGYGLYSVKLIVDGHHGKVWGESEGPGKGSTFYVELDLV